VTIREPGGQFIFFDEIEREKRLVPSVAAAGEPKVGQK
jgi:hypothetical protein